MKPNRIHLYYNVQRYVTLLWQKRSLNYYFFLFFYSKNFLYNVNGILFARSDDRSEVGMCMKWDYSF